MLWQQTQYGNLFVFSISVFQLLIRIYHVFYAYNKALSKLPAVLILADKHPVVRNFIHERHERTRRKPQIRVCFVLFRVLRG